MVRTGSVVAGKVVIVCYSTGGDSDLHNYMRMMNPSQVQLDALEAAAAAVSSRDEEEIEEEGEYDCDEDE